MSGGGRWATSSVISAPSFLCEREGDAVLFVKRNRLAETCETAFIFLTLPEAAALTAPALGTAAQVVGRLVACDSERCTALLEEAAAAPPRGQAGGGGVARPAARLRLDTSLLPPGDVHAVLPRSTVHVFGTLLGAPDGGGGGDEAMGRVEAAGRVLRVVILRAVPDADVDLLATTLRLRAAFLARMAAEGLQG